MAALKLGSKSQARFERRGEAWLCSVTTTGLPADVAFQVEGMKFNLHKFPLLTKSRKLARLINEGNDEIVLEDIPGGLEAFELAAKFCYGVRLELTSSNIIPLRCAAEYLEMGDGNDDEGNLVNRTEAFLNQVVLRSWKDSVRALASCERVLEHAERLGLVKRCVDSIASKCCCSDPGLFGWPLHDTAAHKHLGAGAHQSPGGTILWNGIPAGAKPRRAARIDWWYDDVVSVLSVNMFRRLVLAMEHRGIKEEIIGGVVVAYARRYLPGLDRKHGGTTGGGSSVGSSSGGAGFITDYDQVQLLESIEEMLPAHKGVVPTRFLFGLLRHALVLKASNECRANLEARIGLQLEDALVDDLLVPNYSDSPILYDVDVVQRIVDHFVAYYEQQGDSAAVAAVAAAAASYEDGLASPAGMTPLMTVAKLLDAYLAEIAPDENIKPVKFQALAESLPEYARVIDDGLYRAIDIYLKAHPWLPEVERERLCRIMDCQKLSLEACTHAAQNERLPLRVIVQVLFFEQLQLRTAIAGCFINAENAESTSRPAAAGTGAANARRQQHASEAGAAATAGRNETWANVLRENQVMRLDMDKMRSRVKELEKECSQMRHQIDKLGSKTGKVSAPAGGGAATAAAPSGRFSFTKRLSCRTRLDAEPRHSSKLSTVAEDDVACLTGVDDTATIASTEGQPRRRHHRRSQSLA